MVVSVTEEKPDFSKAEKMWALAKYSNGINTPSVTHYDVGGTFCLNFEIDVVPELRQTITAAEFEAVNKWLDRLPSGIYFKCFRCRTMKVAGMIVLDSSSRVYCEECAP